MGERIWSRICPCQRRLTPGTELNNYDDDSDRSTWSDGKSELNVKSYFFNLDHSFLRRRFDTQVGHDCTIIHFIAPLGT